MNTLPGIRESLLGLSHQLGMPEHQLAIIGEGNTSAIIDPDSFLVKASGVELRNLHKDHLVQVRFDKILAMLDHEFDQESIQKLLLAARVDGNDPKPSVETAFHAWLLKQEGVDYVGHTHPAAVNAILCSKQAAAYAEKRLFPDQIVYCGAKSLLIDYVDPGIKLAETLRDEWENFVTANGFTPKLILLMNHGIIAVGQTPNEVLATTLMAVKAAETFSVACRMGGPIYMNAREVITIQNRLDEHYRQKQLNTL